MNAIVPVSAAPVMTIPEVERVALAIAKGGLFGSTDPNAVLTLCLLAQAEGQHPAVVFRDYHIIQGKPAKKADAMLRDFVNAGGTVEWHKLDDTQADATFSHPGGGTVRIDWTMERARTAGLATPMWKKYPRQMLRSRVISEGVRTVYPGATSGLYEVGEVQDIAAERAPVAPEPEVIDATPVKRERVKLEGPHETQSALKAAVRAFMHEVNRAPDIDSFEALIVSEAELITQIKRDAADWWDGSAAPDRPGIEAQIEAVRDRLREEAVAEGAVPETVEG